MIRSALRIKNIRFSVPKFIQAPNTNFYNKPISYFSSEYDQAIKKLSSQIDEQLKVQLQNPRDYKAVEKQFADKGWEVKYHRHRIQLWKTSGKFKVRLVFKAKAIIDFGDNQNNQRITEERKKAPDLFPPQQQEERQQSDSQVGEVLAYVHKEGYPNWLLMNFIISLRQEVELEAIGFVKDFENDNRLRTQGQNPPFQLEGPQLVMFTHQFQDALYQFLQSIGIKPIDLQAAVQLGSFYQQQFHMQWLKQLKKFI